MNNNKFGISDFFILSGIALGLWKIIEIVVWCIQHVRII